jgi:hypothetical protein
VPRFESIGPNPFAGTADVALTLPDGGAASVRLYDVAGRFVREVRRVAGAGPHRFALDSDGLASGVYFLRVEGSAGEDVRKITVVR